MKTTLKLMAAAFGLSVGVAHAGFITVGGAPAGTDGQVSSFDSACTVNFNKGNAVNTCGVVYGNVSSSNFPTGSNALHTAPPGDTTAYLTVGPSEGNNVAATLLNRANYFGFYTGIMGSSDLVQFYMGGVLIDSFTGDDINAVAFPNIDRFAADLAPFAYINYFPTIGNRQAFYDFILFSSSQNALETDNHAFAVEFLQTPEPESLALLGLGALALAATRRRKAVA